MRTVGAGLDSRRRRKHSIDNLVDEYVRWRQESLSVRRAYDLWVLAPPRQHVLAHAAYVAALDREEEAAVTYQRRLQQAVAR